MKRKEILCGLSVSAIVAMTTWNVNLGSRTNGMSDVMLANIEALAQEGAGNQRVTCYNNFFGLQGAPMEDKTYCADCKDRPAQDWSGPSECFK
ncbi:MAG: NVEALA domain-containing protein [Tannerella sp.]|jgi:hypothetical protein|nr:NVEALA domain-containing protein [Tannerella sp.]